MRLAGPDPRRLERVDDGRDVVAVDLLRLPAEGAPLLAHRLHVEDDRAVGLDAVAVDEGDEIVELEMGAGHRRLPGRSLLHLAVGQLDEDPRRRAVEPEAERLADALAEAVAERAADDLDARRRVERAHLEAAAVGAIGGQLRDGQDPGLGQRRPERDRVVPGREQEAVALRPVDIVAGRSGARGNRAPRAGRRCRGPGRYSPEPCPRAMVSMWRRRLAARNLQRREIGVSEVRLSRAMVSPCRGRR